jgi:hypothetical protein
MPKKKSASRKKSPAKKAAGRKAAAKKAVPKKTAKKKTGAKRSTAARKPPQRKKTNPRAGTGIASPSRQQPVPPGSEQPAQLAGQEDEHGPMHIPSHKPAPAYAQMHQNDWSGKPPQHDIPIPKH